MTEELVQSSGYVVLDGVIQKAFKFEVFHDDGGHEYYYYYSKDGEYLGSSYEFWAHNYKACLSKAIKRLERGSYD